MEKKVKESLEKRSPANQLMIKATNAKLQKEHEAYCKTHNLSIDAFQEAMIDQIYKGTPVMKVDPKKFAPLGNVPESIYSVKVKRGSMKKKAKPLKGSDIIKARARHQSKTEARTLNDISKEYSEEYAKAVEKSYKASIGAQLITDPRLIKAINKKDFLRKKAENQISDIPIHYNEIKKPIKVVKKGYTLTKGFIKLKQEPVFDCEFVLGKNALVGWTKKPAKKKNYNAKKLKEKHKDLWLAIGKAVALDITDQQSIVNSMKTKSCQNVGHIPMIFIENVAENAAFTAIVEMIKRGLL